MSAATVQLAGSVALVTGGGRGVGRMLARALAAVGAAVGLIARSRGQLTESVRLIEAAGGVATVASANLSDPESATTAMDKLRHELGPVDLLVNNAGVNGPVGLAWDVLEEDWWRTVEIDLRTTTWMRLSPVPRTCYAMTSTCCGCVTCRPERCGRVSSNSRDRTAPMQYESCSLQPAWS